MTQVKFNFLEDCDDSYERFESIEVKLVPHTGDITYINGFFHYVVQSVIYIEQNAAEVFLAKSCQDKATALQVGLAYIEDLHELALNDENSRKNIKDYGFHFEALNAASRFTESS